MQYSGEYVICPCGNTVAVELALDGTWCSIACREDPDVCDYAVDERGPWMTTFTAKRFYPMNPDPAKITIEDIAHALSNTCRWNGHTTVYYSVAQHCIAASVVAATPYRMAMLLHDAAEAYMGDLVRPLKRGTDMGRQFAVIEDRVQEAVLVAFNVEAPPRKKQKYWDNRCLIAEADDLINQDWIEALRDRLKVERFPHEMIIPLTPTQAEQAFLCRFVELS